MMRRSPGVMLINYDQPGEKTVRIPALQKENGGWRCGADCDIRSAMESTTGSRSVTLGWKLLILIPLAVAVVLAVISSRQTDLHAGNKLTIIANLFVPIALITQALYWVLVKKWTGWGIAMLIYASALLGFGLHVLLRALTH